MQLPSLPWNSSSIWLIAKLTRLLAARKSVLVVDTGVNADAAEATMRGAHNFWVWKRIVVRMSEL